MHDQEELLSYIWSINAPNAIAQSIYGTTTKKDYLAAPEE
jgi:hypothetical protein